MSENIAAMNSKPELVGKIEETTKITTEKNSGSEMVGEKGEVAKEIQEKTEESSMYQPPCPGKNSWPELVGTNGESAKITIEKENENVEAIVLLDGTPVTRDLRCDRVWVWVDESGVVVRTPETR